MTGYDGGFTTTLGCHVRIVDAPEHLGPGCLLLLRVDDGRPQVEVYFTPQEARALRVLLREDARDARNDEVALRLALLRYAEAIRDEEAQDALVAGFEEQQAAAMGAAREARTEQTIARETIIALVQDRAD